MKKFDKKYFLQSHYFTFILLFLSLVIFLLSGLQLLGLIFVPTIFYALSFIALAALSIYNFIQLESHDGLSISENKELRDSLTLLPNLPLYLEYLDHSLSIAKREKKALAVVKFDIDKLSNINQHYGYKKVDDLILDVATRLRDLTRESDTVARLGGGRFGLILNLIDHDEDSDRAFQRILNGMKLPFNINGDNIVLNVSYGVAVYPTDEGSSDVLNHFSDLALENAKQAGGNEYRYYNSNMNQNNTKRLNEEYDLRKALENNEFCVYFQPKVDAATGTIKGMEALIRWMHPERGIVSPIEFIPLLEESGMIVEAGDWILRESCRLNKQWQDQGFDKLCVSVNVSSVQFKQGDFIERIALALKDTGLDPKYLEVELTESCLMDDATKTIELLQEIKEMGLAISIDDFGTGYSSLSYLKKFPIDTLKIDRSFITNVQDRRCGDNAAIVTAIMALSHSLRLDVVAEGVETAQELAYLHALGCKTIQGFLFSKPLSVDEFTKIQQDSMHMKNILENVRAELAN